MTYSTYRGLRQAWLLALLCLAGLLAGPASADDPPWQDAPPAKPAKPGVPPPAPPVEPATPGTDREPVDATPPTEAKPEKQYKCLVTGEPWNASSTRVEAIFEIDGEKQRGHFLGLPFMLIQYKLLRDAHHQVNIVRVSVLDYPSFGTGGERMIVVNDDWSNVVFLRTDKPLPGSKGPYFAAFSDADEIDAAKKVLGGKLLNYKSVLQQIFGALNAEEELPDSPDRHHTDLP